MARFLLKYVFVGLFASIAIVLISPFVRVHDTPGALEGLQARIETHPRAAPLAEFLRSSLAWSPGSRGGVETVAPPPTAEHVAPARAPAESAEEAETVLDTEPDTENEKEPSAAPSPRPQAPAPAAPQAPSNPVWGVIQVPSTTMFNQKGKLVGKITAGKVVKISELKKTKSGTFALCTVLPRKARTDDILIRLSDIDTHSRALADVSRQEMNLIVMRAQSRADIARLEEEWASADRTDNPHFNEMVTARNMYREYWARVQKLQRERDDAGDPDAHVRLTDQLKAMRGEDVRVGNAYELTRKKYQEWNEANPRPPLSSDPRMNILKSRLDDIESQLSSLGPAS